MPCTAWTAPARLEFLTRALALRRLGTVETLCFSVLPSARVVFTVKIDDNGDKLCCEYGLFEHSGMLCCHSLTVGMISFL